MRQFSVNPEETFAKEKLRKDTRDSWEPRAKAMWHFAYIYILWAAFVYDSIKKKRQKKPQSGKTVLSEAGVPVSARGPGPLKTL